jgi:hypothetical protein
MKESILKQKKENFDDAIKTYKEFKLGHLSDDGKFHAEYLSDDIYDMLYDLQTNIWMTRDVYNLELKNEKFESSVDTKTVMNYDNKNLFIFHNTDWNKFTLVALKEENKIKLGLSICNDNDNFSRKVGRELAFIRTNNGRWTIPCKESDPLKIRQDLYLLVQDIIDNFDYYKQNYI